MLKRVPDCAESALKSSSGSPEGSMMMFIFQQVLRDGKCGEDPSGGILTHLFSLLGSSH